MFREWCRELLHAVRVLRRSPGVTLLSVITMGAGIGISTILFAMVNSIVLRPLPYPEPERLVRIFDVNSRAGISRTGVTTGNLYDWQYVEAFDGVAGYYAMGRTLSFATDSEVLITAQVTRDFFKVLRVAPEIGRVFTEDETQRAVFSSAAAPTGADPVVILSHRIWMQRFGGDPNVSGRIIHIERRAFRVVGVMPEHFAMPDAAVQLWMPWSISSDSPRDQHYVSAVARVKAGISIPQAQDMLSGVVRELGAAYPATNAGWEIVLSPLAVETVGNAAGALWILLAAVGFVLVVACANVALLALIRGLDRQSETAVRVALGASSSRLLREFLLESVLLAVAGGIAGAALTAAGLILLPSLATDLPRLQEVAFDVRSLVFIIAVTATSAILSGLPQAWPRARISPLTGVSVNSRVTEGIDRHLLRDGFVVIQVAMAVILMMGSGLLVRSFLQLRRTDPGFDARGVLVAPVFLDTQAYNSGEKTRTYYRTLFEKLSALPGVIAVGGATTLPASTLGPDFERPVWPEASGGDTSSRVPASVRMVTTRYFNALGFRITNGRAFDDRDSPEAPRVLIVSETLARRVWPGQTAVGKRLVVDYSTAGTYPYEVVGVVGDVRFRGPRSEPLAEVYLPHAQRSYLVLNVAVKTSGDPRALIPAVRQALKSIDPQKPAQGLYPLEELVGATYARDRQVMVTLLVFASAATFLAVLSVYGVLSQRVRERSRDIGIRLAIGANPVSVMMWVAGSGLRLIGVGVLSGVILARILSSTLDGLLFGVTANDGLTTFVVMSIVACCGMIAMLVPSWRATRIDPVRVLRRG